ncbi:MAG: hypothetical protein OXC63_11820 [Aestuariivita sp.]|nr:hypothetical protein [Aestuariivita sp.]MCY4347360.1 hypothetical protein [Aestuariivita sp.]
MNTSRRVRATDELPDKLDRKPIKFDEFTAAMQQLMAAEPSTKSKNRELTRCELNQKFRMTRRD